MADISRKCRRPNLRTSLCPRRKREPAIVGGWTDPEWATPLGLSLRSKRRAGPQS
jgi:hypothetical protein